MIHRKRTFQRRTKGFPGIGRQGLDEKEGHTRIVWSFVRRTIDGRIVEIVLDNRVEGHVDEIISFNDQFYILASSSMADNRTRVLKHGETFGVFDRYGDIQPVGRGTQGIYHEGTRFLSRQELFLDNDRPMMLSSTEIGRAHV